MFRLVIHISHDQLNLVTLSNQAYFTYMKDVAFLLGADEVETEKQMLETLKFEMKLANISLPR